MGPGAPYLELLDLLGIVTALPGSHCDRKSLEEGCSDAHVDVDDAQSEGGCWLFRSSPWNSDMWHMIPTEVHG